MKHPRAIHFALIGAFLSTGGPLGWLALRALRHPLGRGLSGELASHAELYLYLLISSMIAFVLFGAVLGRLADKLAAADALHARESITDGLTGLYNKRYFQRRLSEELARSDRSGHPLALVMADLDHFKRLNDRYGHPVGDRVLEGVGKRIQETCRASDIACRIGGEELAVLCPETEAETAFGLADRLRASVEALGVSTHGEPVFLTASFGVGQRWANEPADAFVERVDSALYRAKQNGRNRVERAGQKVSAA